MEKTPREVSGVLSPFLNNYSRCLELLTGHVNVHLSRWTRYFFPLSWLICYILSTVSIFSQCLSLSPLPLTRTLPVRMPMQLSFAQSGTCSKYVSWDAWPSISGALIDAGFNLATISLRHVEIFACYRSWTMSESTRPCWNPRSSLMVEESLTVCTTSFSI